MGGKCQGYNVEGRVYRRIWCFVIDTEIYTVSAFLIRETGVVSGEMLIIRNHKRADTRHWNGNSDFETVKAEMEVIGNEWRARGKPIPDFSEERRNGRKFE